MPTFKNMNDFFKHLQKDCNKVLQNEVAETVKETMSAEIQNTVYASYEPIQYDRRFDHGGLMDINNMNTELIRDGVIAVSNDTPLASGYPNSNDSISLTEIILTGKGYDYTGHGGAYEEPRDFIEATREDLKQTNAHGKALKDGLRKLGYTIK